jgi:hypothetical protein
MIGSPNLSQQAKDLVLSLLRVKSMVGERERRQPAPLPLPRYHKTAFYMHSSRSTALIM